MTISVRSTVPVTVKGDVLDEYDELFAGDEPDLEELEADEPGVRVSVAPGWSAEQIEIAAAQPERADLRGRHGDVVRAVATVQRVAAAAAVAVLAPVMPAAALIT